MEEHLKYVQQVFQKFWNAKLLMKQSKCHFFTKEIQYLDHILSSTGIKPFSSKTEEIKVMKPVRDAKQVSAFLGLVGYYQKFIKHFVHKAKPLTTLLWHNVKFIWTQI